MSGDWLAQTAAALASGRLRVIDLAQRWHTGMPRWPTHPPFLYAPTKLHGDMVYENGASSAAEEIALGTHVGTHIDALCHFSKDGRLHGGATAEGNQSVERGLAIASIDSVPPIVRRGVLLDAAPGGDPLPPKYAVTAERLDEAAKRAGVEVRGGDVVLVRTGWGQLWDRPREMAGHGGAPGVDPGGAQWLSARRVFAAGTDTLAFEVAPTSTFPVHVHLLVENGIHIIEALNLEALRHAGIREFLFVASPLKISGATASPIRPFAIV